MAVRGLAAAAGTPAAVTTDSYVTFGCGVLWSVAVAAADSVTSHQGLKQPLSGLFSLAVSCMKLPAAAASVDGSVWAAISRASTVLAAAVRLAQAAQSLCAAESSAATSSGAGISSSLSAMLLLLWARILVYAGEGLLTVAAAAAAASVHNDTAASTSAAAAGSDVPSYDDVQQFAGSACVAGLRAVQQLLRAVQLPGAAGSEAACAAAHKQLQQQCSQLLEQLVPANEPSSSATVAWPLPAFLHVADSASSPVLPLAKAAALDLQCTQQLVRFGQALCAQLPVPLCCNNPGCVVLRGSSEQRLVAGKGSVCSRCRCVAAQDWRKVGAA
jgi:hypothetical protein